MADVGGPEHGGTPLVLTVYEVVLSDGVGEEINAEEEDFYIRNRVETSK